MRTDTTRNQLRALAGLVLSVLTLAALCPGASAYIIRNNTNSTAICAIHNGDSPTPLHAFGVGPNSTFDCVAGTPCNPSTQFNDRYTLRVSMSHTHGIYESNIPLEVGGTVTIGQATRPWTLQPDIHMRSVDTFGVFIEETYPSFGEYSATTRNVQFLGSADCQYFHHFCCNAAGEEAGQPQPPFGVPSVCGAGGFNRECSRAQANRYRANNVHNSFAEEFAFNPLLRGVILAGDLVQAGHPEEWNWYIDSFKGHDRSRYTILPYVFDGLGNHDYDSNIRHPIIRTHIRDHSRNTVRTYGAADPVPHYSWDWHDVHFVQLNLIPSNAPPSSEPRFIPYAALAFLQQDLAQHVGSTGRPVFIIHHFGLNEPDWFDDNQKAQYWDAIAPYNVRGIMHGHTHLGNTDFSEGSGGRWGKWFRPAGSLQAGPPFIRTFNISSAGDGGVYCEMLMGPNNSITLTMRDEYGQHLHTQEGLNFDSDPARAVYVAPGPAGSGDGDSRYPWTSVQNAVSAVMTLPAVALNPTTPIRVSAGTYTEAVTANHSRRIRLEAVGGLVRIGQP
ncbi:MAG: metallophosphoesterase [Planctomycetota bacterium]|nr:metallophosphoesterase [Planctomycetota bacterium]